MPDLTHVRPVARRRGIATEVADEIRETILTRQLSAGDHLGTEATVAEAFGVSRPTLREALSGLEALGVISRRRGVQGGIIVSVPETDRFVQSIAVQSVLMNLPSDELLSTQLAIEVATTRLAAHRVRAADLSRLRRIHERTRRMVGKPREFAAAGMKLHVAIAELSGSTLLQAIMRAFKEIRVEGSEHRVRDLDEDALMQRHETILRGHEAVVAALQARDPDQAMIAMAAHLEVHRSPDPEAER